MLTENWLAMQSRVLYVDDPLVERVPKWYDEGLAWCTLMVSASEALEMRDTLPLFIVESHRPRILDIPRDDRIIVW